MAGNAAPLAATASFFLEMHRLNLGRSPSPTYAKPTKASSAIGWKGDALPIFVIASVAKQSMDLGLGLPRRLRLLATTREG